jgi:hypothetical protein
LQWLVRKATKAFRKRSTEPLWSSRITATITDPMIALKSMPKTTGRRSEDNGGSTCRLVQRAGCPAVVRGDFRGSAVRLWRAGRLDAGVEARRVQYEELRAVIPCGLRSTPACAAKAPPVTVIISAPQTPWVRVECGRCALSRHRQGAQLLRQC